MNLNIDFIKGGELFSACRVEYFELTRSNTCQLVNNSL